MQLKEKPGFSGLLSSAVAQQWIIRHQRGFHFIMLVLSVIVLSSCIRAGEQLRAGYLFFLLLPAFLLVLACVFYMWSWWQYTKYEYYAKNIRQQSARLINRHAYKLERLSATEYGLLLLLLEDYPLELISRRMQISYSQLYKHVDSVMKKLEITRKEELLDINWQEAAV